MRLHPGEFSALRTFREEHEVYADPVLLAFDREVQFYVSYLDYIALARRAGLAFCYPELSGSKEIVGQDCFDFVLARKLADEGVAAMTNDFYLRGEERILVVTGPNQGGKSTFAEPRVAALPRPAGPARAGFGGQAFYLRLNIHSLREGGGQTGQARPPEGGARATEVYARQGHAEEPHRAQRDALLHLAPGGPLHRAQDPRARLGAGRPLRLRHLHGRARLARMRACRLGPASAPTAADGAGPDLGDLERDLWLPML